MATALTYSPSLWRRIWRRTPFSRTTEVLSEPEDAEQDSTRAELNATQEELTLYQEWMGKIAKICEQASEGDLEPRLLHCPESKDLARAVQSINHLLDMTDAFLREVGASLDHAANKKFYRSVLLRGMRGAFRSASQQINDTTQQLAADHTKLVHAEEGRKAMSETVQNVVAGLGSTSTRMNVTAQAFSRVSG